ncbi:hypothetical protein GXP67_20180 [Rhodocytophaga rosea]|uniref:Uncharacterized protein n=1 Tax=Rhodocytophaga rosea TaxID=2704465 RepID=A0A6C0GMH3_9BACT|nr:hypothetical protein [Rhodocytophaga rosea]QHT68802.1 hypothetical protein GXP67_20180 [Rhodocytophaga rosea]
MARKIFFSLIIPLLLGSLLIIWEQLTKYNFRFFGAIILFFVLAILVSLVAKRKIKRNYLPVVITFMVLTIGISLLISPNPYVLWQTWLKVKKDSQPSSLQSIDSKREYQLVYLDDARTLPDAITKRIFNFKGSYNGSRAMVPLVNKEYQSGDSIKAYAAFSSYVGDMDNAGWFILDKDEEDYQNDWLTDRVDNAFLIKDTAKIAVFTEMMHQLNDKHSLMAASQKEFVILNYPQADLGYVAKKIRQIGILLIALLLIVDVRAIISNKP